LTNTSSIFVDEPVTIADSLELNNELEMDTGVDLTLEDSSTVVIANTAGELTNAPVYSDASSSSVWYQVGATSGNELPDTLGTLRVDNEASGSITASLEESKSLHVVHTLDLQDRLAINNADEFSLANGATAEVGNNNPFAANTSGQRSATEDAFAVASEDTVHLTYDGETQTDTLLWNRDLSVGKLTVSNDVALTSIPDYTRWADYLTLDADLDVNDNGLMVNGDAWFNADGSLSGNNTSGDGNVDNILSFTGDMNSTVYVDEDFASVGDINVQVKKDTSTAWVKIMDNDLDADGSNTVVHLNRGLVSTGSDVALWLDEVIRDVEDGEDSHIIGTVKHDVGASNDGNLDHTFHLGTQKGTYRGLLFDDSGVTSGTITLKHMNSSPLGTTGLPIETEDDTVRSYSPFHWSVKASSNVGASSLTAQLEAEGYGSRGDYDNVGDLRIIRRVAGSQSNPWTMQGSADNYDNFEESDGTTVTSVTGSSGGIRSQESLWAIGIPTTGPLAPSFATAPDSIEVAEGDTSTPQFEADPANEDWSIESYSLSESAPAFAAIDSSSGELTLTPQEGDGGSYDFQVKATDSEGNTGMTDVNVEVTTTTPIAEDDEVGELPKKFALQGNYPNPFNPTTNIAFDLPAQAQVSITVYDMLGREVMNVPTQSMQAGAGKTIQIDASRLASGAYVYRVVARMGDNTKVSSGRMTLLK
jgi:hypothetical protein